MAGLRRIQEPGLFGDDDDEDRGGPSIVFYLGGRLDLPTDFSVPAMRLAPVEELAAAAREAPTMARLSAFVDWVGKGRRLGEDGELEVSEQEDLASHPGLEPEEWLKTDDDIVAQDPYYSEVFPANGVGRGGRVRLPPRPQTSPPGCRARHAGRSPGRLRSAFEALIELGVVDPGGNGPPWGDTVDAAIPDLIVLANTTAAPLPLAEVVERLCSQEQELLELRSEDRPNTTCAEFPTGPIVRA